MRDAARPSLDFDLPDGAGFAALPPRVSLERMIRGVRQLRAWFPDAIPASEERCRAKTIEEFKL